MNFLVKKAISPSNLSRPPPTIAPLPAPSTPASRPLYPRFRTLYPRFRTLYPRTPAPLSTPSFQPIIYMNDLQIIEVDCHKHLGLHLSKGEPWHFHINSIHEKARTRINIMWAVTRDFQKCCILTSVEPVHPTFKLRNFRCRSVA